MAILFPVLLACLGLSSATSVPYSEYILAPKSRTVIAPRVHKVNGTVSNAASLTKANGGAATFNGVSSVTFDYGINIAGVVSVTVGKSSNQNASIGLTYTESSLWISGQASDGTADAGLDEVLWLPVGKSPGTYTVDRAHERGGFRYLSLVSKTNATIEVMKLVTNYTAAPVQDLRAYRGYFHSNDELLNRIWYAGKFSALNFCDCTDQRQVHIQINCATSIQSTGMRSSGNDQFHTEHFASPD